MKSFLFRENFKMKLGFIYFYPLIVSGCLENLNITCSICRGNLIDPATDTPLIFSYQQKICDDYQA